MILGTLRLFTFASGFLTYSSKRKMSFYSILVFARNSSLELEEMLDNDQIDDEVNIPNMGIFKNCAQIACRFRVKEDNLTDAPQEKEDQSKRHLNHA